MRLFETFTETAQTTTPKELPIIGDPWNQIDITLVQNDKRYFRLHGKKLQLSQPLDRDEDDISSIVFQVNYYKCICLMHTYSKLFAMSYRFSNISKTVLRCIRRFTNFFPPFIFQCAK